MKTPRFLVAACIALALAFTFSCSSDDDDIGGDIGGGIGIGCSIDDYRIVEIGDQTWMAENYNCEVDGSVCYDNNPANCVTYGRLYDWATAMGLNSNCNSSACSDQVQSKHRGICPSGWHIPSDAEWDELLKVVGSGAKLKAESGWNNNGNGTDDFGFSALPGGRSYGNGFFNVGYGGIWWSSTEDNATEAYNRSMNASGSNMLRLYDGKSIRYSVRCVQD